MIYARQLVISCLAIVFFIACGGAEGVVAQPIDVYTKNPEVSTIKSSLQVVLASTDISVGINRIVFGVIDDSFGPLGNSSNVQIAAYLLNDSKARAQTENVGAVFRQWPSGVHGVYTSQINFDRAGEWALEVSVTAADGLSEMAFKQISVREESLTPALGSSAPRSESKTVADVVSLKELTSDGSPDIRLYEMSIPEALDSGRPLVLTFGTPAYCMTATCGPQLEVVKDSMAQNWPKVNYIHVEVYDNLQDIHGELSNARISPTLIEWGIPSEPWTFVIDAEGIIHAKFEGFVTLEELEQAVLDALFPIREDGHYGG